VLVEIEDDPRSGLVALGYGRTEFQNHAERVRAAIVRGFHEWLLQYRCTLLVRYTVTTSSGNRSVSTTTLKRYLLGGLPRELDPSEPRLLSGMRRQEVRTD
jgi:hypothetical protein